MMADAKLAPRSYIRGILPSRAVCRICVCIFQRKDHRAQLQDPCLRICGSWRHRHRSSPQPSAGLYLAQMGGDVIRVDHDGGGQTSIAGPKPQRRVFILDGWPEKG